MGTTTIARKKTLADHASDAANAHTNLNTWGAVVTLLEGGHLYGGHNYSAVQRVIKIAKAQMQVHLAQHDMALLRAKRAGARQ